MLSISLYNPKLKLTHQTTAATSSPSSSEPFCRVFRLLVGLRSSGSLCVGPGPSSQASLLAPTSSSAPTLLNDSSSSWTSVQQLFYQYRYCTVPYSNMGRNCWIPSVRHKSPSVSDQSCHSLTVFIAGIYRNRACITSMLREKEFSSELNSIKSFELKSVCRMYDVALTG